MRTFFTILYFLTCTVIYGQDSRTSQEINDIAASEQRRFDNLGTAQKLRTSAVPSNFDVKYYRAEWEVDPAVYYIKGKVTTYYLLNTSAASISIDLKSNLTVSGVFQHNLPLSFTRTTDVLEVNFPSVIASGTLDSIQIVYEGVPAGATTGSFVSSSHGSPSTPVMWTLSEPFGSSEWWPCKNDLTDKADSLDIYITHPSAYKAAANGLLKSETSIAGNKTITHWKHRYPIASYLVCFAVTNYAVFNRSVFIGSKELPMQTFCYPESQSSFEAGTQNTLNALVLYSNLFGDYPFINEKYGHVQFGWSGGMEHQTNSFMTSLNEGLVVHELGHQWFGDKVTCASWENIWLNEGFATHLASIYMENKYPAGVRATRLIEINKITALPGGSVRVDDVTSSSRIFSDRLTYLKGSHLVYMLRWILGDAVFFTAARNYLEDPALAFGFATTDNLRSHLESASGKDLGYFFDQWYSGQGYPSYQMQWYTAGNTVKIKLSQSTSHPSVTFFRLPVPLLFKNTTTNQEKLVIVDNSYSGQSFTEDLGFEAESVTIDPDYWLVSRNNTTTKISAPLPVTFTSFTAGCRGTSVLLNWSTSMEQNAAYFEVQKSTDAVKWIAAGSVDAAGDHTGLRRYTYLDQAVSGNGSYYRIIETDGDGSKQNTGILYKSCSTGTHEGLMISPNPVTDRLKIELPKEVDYPVSAEIFNLSGKLISHKTLETSTKKDEYLMNTTMLSPGSYVLKVESASGLFSQTVKFLKE